MIMQSSLLGIDYRKSNELIAEWIRPTLSSLIRMEHYHPKDEMKRYVRAFIYLATKLGKEKSVAEDLWRIPEIKEVHIVPGKYDILAVAEVERKFLEPDTQNIYWFLLSRIEGISGIEDTSTIIPVLSMSHWSH